VRHATKRTRIFVCKTEDRRLNVRSHQKRCDFSRRPKRVSLLARPFGASQKRVARVHNKYKAELVVSYSVVDEANDTDLYGDETLR